MLITTTMNSLPELLAPAGDLPMAIKALLAGADAVYIGLKDFSARKSAANFDWEDLRKLHQFAIEHDKKVYVAINTIIREKEIPQLLETLTQLDLLKPDGIIIQDLGVLNIIKTHFPNLTVHASTQMTVNSIESAMMAKKLEITRVILPRETTITEIKTLRQRCPDLELETFIHGALCYSFSGLCLVSGLLLGRSGNRGQCAQICRNYFETEQGSCYPLSCNDLFLSEKVKELQNIGVHSLKIEGRLKKPEYVVAVVKLYRHILDNKTPNKTPNQTKIESLEQDVYQSFSRNKTSAYFDDPKGKDLINPNYSKNVGKLLGKITNIVGRSFEIEADNHSTPLRKGDELLILAPGFNLRSKKLVVTKVDGKTISVYHDEDIKENDIAYLFARTDKANKPKKEVLPRLPLWKKSIPIDIEYSSGQLSLSTTLYGEKIEQQAQIELQEREGSGNIIDSFKKILSKTDRSWFKGVANLKTKSLENKFISPSKIKEIKNLLWAQIDNNWNNTIKAKVSDAIPCAATVADSFFSTRNNLSPKNSSKVPFAHQKDFQDLINFATHENDIYIPLHPLLSTTSYLESLTETIKANPEKSFVIGLNNLSHIHWLQECGFDNIFYWIDYSLYVANSYCLDMICLQLPVSKMKFAYHWVEDHEAGLNLVTIKDKEILPHMISKGCVKKNVFDKENGCKGCDGSFSYDLRGNPTNFSLQARECINYLFIRED